MIDSKINHRPLISIALALCALILTASGIAMIWFEHAEPDKRLLHFWTHAHLLAAFFFTVSGIWHLFLNWRLMQNYLTGACHRNK